MPAKKLEDLPADAFVLIRLAGEITIEAVHKDLSQYFDVEAGSPLFYFTVSVFEDPVTHQEVWRINNSAAVNGFGPLVYDIAMELASMHGRAGLMTGTGLSPDSTRVWDYYVEKRADVGKVEFDKAHPWWSKDAQKPGEPPRPYIDPKYPYIWSKLPDLAPKLEETGKAIFKKGSDDLLVDVPSNPDSELEGQLNKILNADKLES